MDGRQLWLESLWPEVLGYLPPPPAVVVEIGCGRRGGFVPALLQDGYQALGIDPAAPEADSYQQVEFEASELPSQVHAFVACTSLHHVGDLEVVVDRMAGAITPDGVVVIIEWDWKSFDRATAEWSFARLGAAADDGDGESADEHKSWLHHQHQQWQESQQPWEDYLRDWTEQHHIHTATAVLGELDRRFERVHYGRGTYLFPELVDTTEADELDAINQGAIQATRINYVGRLPGVAQHQ